MLHKNENIENKINSNDYLLQKIIKLPFFQLIFIETNNNYLFIKHLRSVFDFKDIELESKDNFKQFYEKINTENSTILVSGLNKMKDNKKFLSKLNQARDTLTKLNIKLLFVLPFNYTKEIIKSIPDLYSYRNLTLTYFFEQKLLELSNYVEKQNIYSKIDDNEFINLKNKYEENKKTNKQLAETLAIQLIKAFAQRNEKEQIIKLFEENSFSANDLRIIFDILNLSGYYNIIIKLAHKIQNTNNDPDFKYVIKNNLGIAHLNTGDYNTALKFLKDALKIIREIGDKAGEGTTLNNISQIYDASGDYDTALK